MSASGLSEFYDYQAALSRPARGNTAAATRFFAPNALINVCHPFNEMQGVDAYAERFIVSLQRSFESLHRRNYIVMGGEFEGGDWVSATGYYVGNFVRDWIGIRASGELAYLRFGEFHRMKGGRAVESFVFLDIPELMIARGQWPIIGSPGLTRGYTGYLPGPMTHDGCLSSGEDPAESARSLSIVTEMLRSLATPDEAWRRYWDDAMVWYGPAAFGSFLGVDGFASFQVPFESALEGWAGGAAGTGRTTHFTRYGHGPYACSGGWPSLSGVHIAPFLDQPPTQKMLYMRVCDWWRREGDRLVENWVFVDIPDVLLQTGFDVFTAIGAEIP